ncbi:MAG TPA: FmdB family zinc ribbon protein [Bacillota bacterium]|nr:FmdB family zinc ribbon protein [Bacillota bacterium]
MPIYDYNCEKCGRFELMQSIKAEPLTTCPTCGSAVKRLISFNPNIIFKGPGFYKTDNRKPEASSSPKKDKAS